MAQVLSLQSRSIAAALVQRIETPTVRVGTKTREREDQRVLKLRDALGWLRDGMAPLQVRKRLVARGWSTSTARRDVADALSYLDGDANALLPKFRGRPLTPEPWHVRAVQLYRQRSQPNAGDVAFKLWAEGVRLYKKDPDTHELTGQLIKYPSFVARVRNYLAHLPKDQGELSASRLGASYRQGNHLPRKRRDVSDLEIGEGWVSDGHKLKVLCRNAITHSFYRLEITPILDIRSNFWFGTWYARAESSNAVVNLFCHVVRAYQKVPLYFYSDNGPGFKNARTKAMFARIGTLHHTATPGAPFSKGMGETIFRQVIDKFARMYWPDAYCGTDVTDDVIARYSTKYKRGEIYIPTDREVMASLDEYRLAYNSKPQPYSFRLACACPDDLIKELVPDAHPIRPELLLWEEKVLTVRKCSVKFVVHGEAFIYTSKVLAPCETEKVTLLLDGEDASRIWVRDGRGMYLGEIERDQDVGYTQPSVHAAQRQQQLIEAMARNDRQKAIKRSDFDGMHVIEHDAHGSVAEQIQQQGHLLTIPVAVPQRSQIEVLPVNPAFLQRLERELEAEAAEIETETAADRFGRAERLLAQQEAAEELAEADARWLAIYTTSPEFRAQRLMAEARAEERALSAATDAPSFLQPLE